jgi:hypothetical protein
MPVLCAVYGYECTQRAAFDLFELRPRFNALPEAKAKARDKSLYHLTAVLVGDRLTAPIAFQLEAVVSFIEQLDVVITDPIVIDGPDLFSSLPLTLPTHGRHDGGGATLLADVFLGNSRAKFIRSCLRHLQDDHFCSTTQFADLLFKQVETFRQRRPFLEVSYFLLYSGLESHARAVMNDRMNRNSSDPIARLLVSYGFDLAVERPTDPRRSVSTYTHLRNALFHNGDLEATINVNGQAVTLKLLDFYANFLLLVSLVVFKAISFDDGHINWNRWIDCRPSSDTS